MQRSYLTWAQLRFLSPGHPGDEQSPELHRSSDNSTWCGDSLPVNHASTSRERRQESSATFPSFSYPSMNAFSWVRWWTSNVFCNWSSVKPIVCRVRNFLPVISPRMSKRASRWTRSTLPSKTMLINWPVTIRWDSAWVCCGISPMRIRLFVKSSFIRPVYNCFNAFFTSLRQIPSFWRKSLACWATLLKCHIWKATCIPSISCRWCNATSLNRFWMWPFQLLGFSLICSRNRQTMKSTGNCVKKCDWRFYHGKIHTPIWSPTGTNRWMTGSWCWRRCLSRSFKPFFPLLFCTRIPVVQLWAVWAIHHVCSTDRK